MECQVSGREASGCDTCLPKDEFLDATERTPIILDWLRVYCDVGAVCSKRLGMLFPTVTPYRTLHRDKWELTGRLLSPEKQTEAARVGLVCGRVSRVDFCTDVLHKMDLERLYEYFCETHQNVSKYTNNHGGFTVNIGKRSSSRFWRIYDKRAEIFDRLGIDIEQDITRIEFEAKRECSEPYLQLWLDDPERIAADIQVRLGLRLGAPDREFTIPKAAKGDPWQFVERYRKVLAYAYFDNHERFHKLMTEGRRMHQGGIE